MTRRTPWLSPLVLALALPLSCAPEMAPPEVPPPPPPPAPAPTPVVEAPKPRPAFENPGGMWMPQQLAGHADKLRELGLEIDPAQLTDPTSPVLSAVVSLGGCSASFVSPDGLIITNHHCVTGALQYNSTPEQNLLKTGFLAKSRADEKKNAPTARVYVTRAIKDVTQDVLSGLDKITGDKARFDAMEKRQKELTSACEQGKTGVRCTVAKYFDGAQFYQIEQLEIRDVRLAYAPDHGIGNFGGEIDNWRWPRHTGDFSFYRAYVGKDGVPADPSDDNVPFHPAHHLRLAQKPLAEGDLVLVAGYPARTSTLKTAAEVKEAVDWFYPRRQRFCEEYIGILEGLGKTDKDVLIKGASMLRGLHNTLTNVKGQQEGLVKGGLAAQKTKQEGDLAAFIAADPQRQASYGGVLERMSKLHDEYAAFRERDASLNEIQTVPRLLGAAESIVRMAEEREKPDAERKPEFQARNWKRLEQAQVALEKSYSRSMDRALLTGALRRAASRPEADRTEALGLVVGGKGPARGGKAKAAAPRPPTDEAIGKAVDALYEKTEIEDGKVRVKLLQTATTRELQKSKDPILQLALRLRPLRKAAEERDEAYSGAMAIERPKYIAALSAFAKGALAPDANSTLRITYGTVRGYRPAPDAPAYLPFTKLSEVVAKAKTEEPFDAPQRLLDAVKAKKFGPYVDPKLGEVPVDFLADLHITGGNSGSATLNARGELVGLVFDGNYEAMASDWVFMPPITRSIHVDLRYIEWVMDAVDGADVLLKEMGGTPSID